MSDVVFNFAVVFDDDFSSELVAASAACGAVVPLTYALGPSSRPHVTVLQFRGRMTDADLYRARLRSLALPPVALEFDGLAFDRVRGLDGWWLRLKHCPALRDLQRRARAVLGDLHYLNGLDDAYEPHATLAAWPTRDALPALPIPAGILRRSLVARKFALGISGPVFQFERLLFDVTTGAGD